MYAVSLGAPGCLGGFPPGEGVLSRPLQWSPYAEHLLSFGLLRYPFLKGEAQRTNVLCQLDKVTSFSSIHHDCC